MSTALDDFERALVKASRALHAEAELAHRTASSTGVSRAPGGWHLVRRTRQLSVAVQLGLAVTAVSALAAGGAIAFRILTANQTKTLTQVSCALTRTSTAGIQTVTGDPVIDCAAVWPSATAGHASAPPLAAWELGSGKGGAVVQPASWGRPAPDHGVAWHRLPADWTVDLKVVELTDQLSDISISPYGGPPCTYATRDEQVIRSLLRADGLTGWHIVLTPYDQRSAVSSACRFTIANVDGSARTVQLLQARAAGKAHLTPLDRKLSTANNLASQKLTALDKSVNAVLAARCQSVNAAAALWTTHARAAGFAPTSFAFYRTVNTSSDRLLVDRLFNYHYTFVKQPPSQRTGTCAHVLVMRAGGGSLTVYVARITP